MKVGQADGAAEGHLAMPAGSRVPGLSFSRPHRIELRHDGHRAVLRQLLAT